MNPDKIRRAIANVAGQLSRYERMRESLYVLYTSGIITSEVHQDSSELCEKKIAELQQNPIYVAAKQMLEDGGS